MKEFFNVTDLEKVLEYKTNFPIMETEDIPLADTLGRVIAEDIISDMNLPAFDRSVMDGYAVRASSTFGASEANPAYLTIKGNIAMGQLPDFSIGPGEAARISTGGMLPDGADSVVMIEHTELLDDTTIEVYRSVAPAQHIMEVGEDFRKSEVILSAGQKLRSQETGLLAAFGHTFVKVHRQPVISIISTGDEVVPVEQTPGLGKIRDINTYTLAGMIRESGGIPVCFDIVRDNYDALYERCTQALNQSDMVLISGGSSVGMRDFTIDVLSSLPNAKIQVHGISISPGKPTILAAVNNKIVWGLPGHVVSAMIVFSVVVRPFIEHIAGMKDKEELRIPARLTRNVPSAQGRTDYIRVRLSRKDNVLWAEPILGKSGLISTMTRAHGLIEIELNTEGLDKGTEVLVSIL